METLASFSNGVFLLFVSLFLIKEIIERFLESEIEE
jgi:Co/Zn/Cd efflux system component